MNIPNYLEPLVAAVPHNTAQRFDCPKCRGKSTLGITKENGKVKWHCFKASCNLKPGNKSYSRNISELKTVLNAHTAVKQEFKLPDYLIYGLSSSYASLMITEGHCLEVYKQGLFDIAFDPKENRVCFLVKKNNKDIGLIGKAINNKIKPKVLNYQNSDVSTPFICGSTDTIVLVEDCLSAASVCRIKELSGLALLGSSLKNEYLPIVKSYSKCIVALDRDARKKALAIKKKLCYYHPNVKLWLLDMDIKEMSDKELNNSFSNIK